MTDRFDDVTGLLLQGRRGLTLPQLAAAGAIARELDSGRNDEDRLEQLCRKAGTTVRAVQSLPTPGDAGASERSEAGRPPAVSSASGAGAQLTFLDPTEVARGSQAA